jgi:PPM family protein phosphatase
MTSPGFFRKKTKIESIDDGSVRPDVNIDEHPPLDTRNGTENTDGDTDDRTDPLIRSDTKEVTSKEDNGWITIYESMAGRIEKPSDPDSSILPRWVAGNLDDEKIKMLMERLQNIEIPLVPVGEYTTVNDKLAVVLTDELVPFDEYIAGSILRPCEVFQAVIDLINGLQSLKIDSGLMPSSFHSSRLFANPVPFGVAKNGLAWRVRYALLHELIPVEENDLDDEFIRQTLKTAVELLAKCDAPWYLEPAANLKDFFEELLSRKESLFAVTIIDELVSRIGYISGAIASDVGLVRKSNEDNGKISIENSTRPGASLAQMWVADGMGGHAAGEVASHLAITTLDRSLNDWSSSALAGDLVIESHIERAFLRANANIFADADLHPKRIGMGTTLTGFVAISPYPPHAPGERPHAHFDIGRLWCANLGDSRTYLVGSEKLIRLSHDHSFVQQLLDSGSVTEEEAFKHPAKNVISKCLGADKTHDAQPDICTLFCGCGDMFLSASDGLTDLLTDKEMFEVIHDNFVDVSSLRKIAKALIDAANDRGGKDNITVALVYFE